MTRPLTVLYCGTFCRGPGYARERVVREGLESQGVRVLDGRVQMFAGAQDKVGAARQGGIATLLRFIRAQARLATVVLRAPRHDVVLVGCGGHLDVPVVATISAFRRRPLVFDALYSIQDAVVDDRGLVAPGGLRDRLLGWLDDFACRRADLVLVDTPEHVRFFRERFRIPASRIAWVPAGAEVAPSTATPRQANGTFHAVYWGTFVPFHGTDTIVRAAKALEAASPPIRFTLAGSGQALAEVRRLAGRLGPSNLTFEDRWLDAPDLARLAGTADLALGAFGTTPRLQRVVPHKVFDALALGLPVLTADTPATRSVLDRGRYAFLCPPGDPDALAAAVLKARDEPRLRREVADAGHRLYQERFSVEAIGRRLAGILEGL